MLKMQHTVNMRERFDYIKFSLSSHLQFSAQHILNASFFIFQVKKEIAIATCEGMFLFRRKGSPLHKFSPAPIEASRLDTIFPNKVDINFYHWFN